ncbi:dihydrodipicolinate synthase family protein [Aquisalibacillus elongatus]|uniref:4-hydroxy-tetrahydrodipicolinate synthase n=1 Tax=Aquisalibacillus elongatus TaxID=485577 RepID=A0A3N5C7C6_9BACI|nr:dihydrodipicolinate synthase family protein [Aquisalibacillus elongatus]RPF54245.1 4-hydroxy-tetrahydrodipicolinate synthase [Aquisalibacillus elongatus]
MNDLIPNGVWPTMITPFKDNGDIDYDSLENLIEWYINSGVNGLFAVCQSSEMYELSLSERLQLAEFVVDKTNNRIPVIATGNVSFSIDDQIEEIKAMYSTGVDAIVLLTNRLAKKDQSDDVIVESVNKILDNTENIQFGLYECPLPYKRLFSPELLKWFASTERFRFLKDTSCDIELITNKIRAVEGTNLKVFNANAPTLLDSLKTGGDGYSGIMCNFHPDLYVKLYNDFLTNEVKSQKIQDFVGLASTIERQMYPMNSKYYLTLEGVLNTYQCRNSNKEDFINAFKSEIEQMRNLTKSLNFSST